MNACVVGQPATRRTLWYAVSMLVYSSWLRQVRPIPFSQFDVAVLRSNSRGADLTFGASRRFGHDWLRRVETASRMTKSAIRLRRYEAPVLVQVHMPLGERNPPPDAIGRSWLRRPSKCLIEKLAYICPTRQLQVSEAP